MKISPRRQRRQREQTREPLFLWWMPLAGLFLAAGWAMWDAVNSSDDGSGEQLTSFAESLIWPGALIFAVTTFLVWLAWKVEFE